MYFKEEYDKKWKILTGEYGDYKKWKEFNIPIDDPDPEHNPYHVDSDEILKDADYKKWKESTGLEGYDKNLVIVLRKIDTLKEIPVEPHYREMIESFKLDFDPEHSIMIEAIEAKKEEFRMQNKESEMKLELENTGNENDYQKRIEKKIDLILKKLEK